MFKINADNTTIQLILFKIIYICITHYIAMITQGRRINILGSDLLESYWADAVSPYHQESH